MANKIIIIVGLLENLISYKKTLALSEQKELLFSSFLEQGIPTTKDEEWKYTSLKNIVKNDYVIEPKQVHFDKKNITTFCLGSPHKIVFVNGELISQPNIQGVNISGFKSFESKNITALNKLNAAIAKSGYTIEVEKNITLNNHIEILFFNTVKNSFSQYRNNIYVGESSEVKIIESFKDLTNSTNFVNSYTKIDCEENSKIEFNKIQNNSYESELIDCMDVYQKKDSRSTVNTLIFGGGFIRNNLNFEQNGKNCDSTMNGISLLDKDQFADNHTFVDHKTENCTSNELYKGIYLDSSKGVFNGKIMVRKDAQKIDAFQANNNLLLSDNSSIDSKPQLEIYADDVKCSHGCTIGQLDEEALFYMRSRGIGYEEAKAVLTFAFTSEVIENISILSLKEFAKKILSKKLKVDIDL